jgi:hypothetical protein
VAFSGKQPRRAAPSTKNSSNNNNNNSVSVYLDSDKLLEVFEAL